MLEELIKGQPLVVAILLIAVVALSTVVVFLYKANARLQNEKAAIQEQRLEDAQQAKDKLLEPLQELIGLGKKQYDILQFIDGKRGRR